MKVILILLLFILLVITTIINSSDENDNTPDNDNDLDKNDNNNNNIINDGNKPKNNDNSNSRTHTDNSTNIHTSTNDNNKSSNTRTKSKPTKVKKTKVAKAKVTVNSNTHDTNNINNNNQNDNTKRNKTRSDYEEEFLREKEEREKIIEEANRRRAQLAKEDEGKARVKKVLHDSSSDNCDWLKQPLSLIGGEVCGAHYKVLGLKKRQLVTKTEIKKAYRQKSLSVHPDKNPAKDATEAFKVVQDAYECLIDDDCRSAYDYKLESEEESIMMKRKRLRDKVLHFSLEGISHLYYYISVAATRVYGAALDIWTLAGEWEVVWLGEPRPIGRYILGIILAWKGRPLLQITALSYGILRINQELIKRRGLFD